MTQTSTVLARNIKKLRESLKLTQTEFGRQLGLSGHAPISRYEAGHVRPERDVLEKMASLAGRPVEWLDEPPKYSGRNLEGFEELMATAAQLDPADWEEFELEQIVPLAQLYSILQELWPQEPGETREREFESVLNGALPGIGMKELFSAYRRIVSGESYDSVRDRFEVLIELRACAHKIGELDAKLDRLIGLLDP